MLDNSFLQLSEYSNKYGISLSTLRRRIKSGEVEFEFDQGKYWLKDEPIARYVRNRPQTTDKKPVTEVDTKTTSPSNAQVHETLTNVQDFTESAKALMSEIKSAFVKALHEKEEQIMELKEEIADLKTLNKILDQENERLKQSSFSEWMDSPKSD